MESSRALFTQTTVDDLAHWFAVPVINALSDVCHPCQALADMQTIREHFGDLAGLKLAFVGDGNNVAQSLMLNGGAARHGFRDGHVRAGYAPDPGYRCRRRAGLAATPAPRLKITHDPAEALPARTPSIPTSGPAWAQEHEAAERRHAFAAYQVNEELFAHALPGRDLHALPARQARRRSHRRVMESPRSVVFDQAENRLHAQKALLLMLLPERSGLADAPNIDETLGRTI